MRREDVRWYLSDEVLAGLKVKECLELIHATEDTTPSALGVRLDAVMLHATPYLHQHSIK